MTKEEIKVTLEERKDLTEIFRILLSMKEPKRSQAIQALQSMLYFMQK